MKPTLPIATLLLALLSALESRRVNYVFVARIILEKTGYKVPKLDPEKTSHGEISPSLKRLALKIRKLEAYKINKFDKEYRDRLDTHTPF